MPLLTQKRFNASRHSWDLMHTAQITDTMADAIELFFQHHKKNAQRNYQYSISSDAGSKQFFSAIGDIVGFLNANHSKPL